MSTAALPLVPRSRSGLDLAAMDVPHPDPMLFDLRVDAGGMSDVVDHVSNVEYVRWIDRAAELHADALGFTRRWLLEHDLMWFVARHEIDYRAEVRSGDRLVIATWVRDVRRVKSWRDYRVVRTDDGREVCRAATLWVLVSLATRRPVSFTPEMIARFAPLVPPGERAGAGADQGGDASCMSR